MTQYYENHKNKSLSPITKTENDNSFLITMSTEEFRESKEDYSNYKEILHSLGSIRYCKAEILSDCIIGTLRIPQKRPQREAQFSFCFYLTDNSLLLIEDENNINSWIDKHSEMLYGSETPDKLLLRILEQMIDDDVLFLSHIESETEKMEEKINEGLFKDCFVSITKHRQKLSELNAYYEQLTDICELFQSRAGLSLMHEPQEWDRFSRRVGRLQSHVQLLRENMLQIRELYESKQESNQNKIMGILTIVTTFFLPLTLITGWYGMNFVNMPELKWRYGYPAIIIISLCIAIGEIIFFKKKKFF